MMAQCDVTHTNIVTNNKQYREITASPYRYCKDCMYYKSCGVKGVDKKNAQKICRYEEK